jgi:hypothetical protein
MHLRATMVERLQIGILAELQKRRVNFSATLTDWKIGFFRWQLADARRSRD